MQIGDDAKMERQQHVLIVDDNTSLITILSEIFRLAGFEVSTATDGLAAIDAARSLLPDIVICDVGLPERNGFEVCRTLREGDDTRDLPIVLLTARAADSDRHWGLDAGADEYLTKPFDPDCLVDKTRDILAARQAGESRNSLTQLPNLEALAKRTASARGGTGAFTARVLEFESASNDIFRQKYGDLASAEAIRLAAACLRHVAAESGHPLAGVGHSGDASYSRFGIIGPPDAIDDMIGHAERLFDAQVVTLYNERDQQSGGVSLRRPDGSVVTVPFIKLQVIQDDEFEAEIARRRVIDPPGRRRWHAATGAPVWADDRGAIGRPWSVNHDQ